MFFGAQSFSSAPFASQYVQNSTILLTGNRLNITIGNTTVSIIKIVPVTGNQINLANNTVNVINWTPIPPGASQIWIPIDPDNP
jgi:hypothetical protein